MKKLKTIFKSLLSFKKIDSFEVNRPDSRRYVSELKK